MYVPWGWCVLQIEHCTLCPIHLHTCVIIILQCILHYIATCTVFTASCSVAYLHQVWKDRHQAVARDAIDAAAKRIALGSPQQMNSSPSQQAALAQLSNSTPEGETENDSEPTTS